MSPTMQITSPTMGSAHYSGPSSDTVNRHDYAVQKNRKQASTGGGRAWSEDEEVYLLQTRLQKMPYKHIAAHLKKTELACRLHYHQLSHGSNRRKRTASVSSDGSSMHTHSPIMSSASVSTSMPSPIHETSNPATPSSYTSRTYSPGPPVHVQLPAASTLLNQPQSRMSSPPRALNHPVAILPKPSPPRRSHSDSATAPPLRLVTSTTQSQNLFNLPTTIEETRLRQLYDSHRASFWSVIATEYGNGVDPFVLEDFWRRNCASLSGMPPTPCVSPDTKTDLAALSPYQHTVTEQKQQQKVSNDPPTPITATESGNDKTSISALLGIDASPKSPKERELVKKMEERRGSGGDVSMDGI